MNDGTKIILSRALTSSGDQAWDFAVPVTMATLMPQHLEMVALVFFLSKLSHVLILPMLGHLMDGLSRIGSVKIGLTLQFVGVFAQAWALTELSSNQFLAFSGLVLGGISSSLGSSMTSIAVSQDLVPTLFQGDELTKVNSRIRQVDLFSEVGTPVLAGLLLIIKSSSLPYLGIMLIALWNLSSFFPEYLLVKSVFKKHKNLLQKPLMDQVKIPIWIKLSSGWKHLVKLSIAPVIFAYALLWLSVLSPHGVLLTSFLKEAWSLPELTLGIFRGLGAIFGLVATLIFPYAVARLGLVKTCQAAIGLQSTTLLFALVGFYFKSLWPFLGGILISRIGLYVFSLGEQQLRQIYIPEHLRGSINATANAITNLATVFLFGLASVLGSVHQFARLVEISVFCVLMSCLVTYLYSKKSKRNLA